MSATMQDLLRHKLAQDAQAYRRMDAERKATAPWEPKPEPTQAEPATPPWLVEAFAKLDSMSARCGALLERNGVWTRYKTGDES